MNTAHLAALVAATALAAAAGHRLRWLLASSIVASALVALAALTRPALLDEPSWLAFAAYTIALKCIFLPRLLREIRASRQTPVTPRRSALALATACALAAIGYESTAAIGNGAGVVGGALATALVGAFIAANRTDPLARAVGLITLANGAALSLLALPHPGADGFATLAAIDLGVVVLILALRMPVVAAALADGGKATR